MKGWLATVAIVLFFQGAQAQITITAADMPVHGDTLRYSNALPIPSPVSAADSGANMTWTYDLTPISQGLDEYKSPAEISPLYALSLPTDSYGYKVADSIPGIGLLASGISITDLHTFYNIYIGPSAFGAEAFGAKISGFPFGASYTVPDAVYFFPLSYNRNDSAPFDLTFGLAAVGVLKEKGYRRSRVDAWGSITTPYYTTPVSCIRVRSELHEVDSITFSGTTFGLPRVTVEYKYLVNGQHYPAVWATANVVAGLELITSVKYKDVYRPELNPDPTAIHALAAAGSQVSVYPNPATNGIAALQLPAAWKTYQVALFDGQGRMVMHIENNATLNMQALPAGNYIARIIAGGNTAYVQVTK